MSSLALSKEELEELKCLMCEVDSVLLDIRDILSGSWNDAQTPSDSISKATSSLTVRPVCPVASQLSTPPTLIVSSDEELENKRETMPAKKRRVSPVPLKRASGSVVRKLSFD